MSSQESLYDVVHGQFREAFGQPHKFLGGGEQWTLTPSVAPHQSGIHVVLNGTPAKPGVWIFDPYDRHNGVVNTAIDEQRQIDDLITRIQERLKVANHKRDDTSSPVPLPPARYPE